MGLPAHRPALFVPPEGTLPRPDSDDPLEYYYRPYSAWLYRARLRLALRLLGDAPTESLLEVGYGSGIFLPELSRRAGRVAAIDIHEEIDAVRVALDRLGVEAELKQGSLFEIPYGDGEFTSLVCLSVLEHLTDLDTPFEEFARVMKPGGVAVIGFPVRNPITDRLFTTLGFDPREIHPASHDDIVAAAHRSPRFEVEACAQIPRLWPRSLSAYVGCRLRAL
jgi:SAM-dependent methyltransferase